MKLTTRLAHAWDAFRDSTGSRNTSYSMTSSDIVRRRSHGLIMNDKSIVSTIVSRMAVDLGMLDFIHAEVDSNGRYTGERASGLSNCLSVEANLDQNAFAFKIDIAMTMFEEGVACVVPTETNFSPEVTSGYDIRTMRVGRIVGWMPEHVRVELYNEKTGRREELVLNKRFVAIIQNPLYTIMNEPNSTLQRLLRKLALLDTADEQISNSKLDLIIKLPYPVKSEQKKAHATQRLKDIEFQLSQSNLGIAYADATEDITQLNRPLENDLQSKVEYLTTQLYSQLGITKEVLEGSASEEVMNNYFRRTIEPVAKAIAEEFDRKFITKTSRTQGQKVMYLRSQFDFVSTSSIGDLGDKLIRNEILTSNEMRSILGFRPSTDPKADELRNKNMPVKDTEGVGGSPPSEEVVEEVPLQ